CQRALEVPGLERPRTSGLALASLVVAIVGGFTLIGNVVAAVLGWLGLGGIGKRAQELGRTRLGWGGIVVAASLLVVSIGAYIFAEPIGLDGWLRELLWAGRLDRDGRQTAEWSDPGGQKFQLTRKSMRWGVYHSPKGDVDWHRDWILVN